MNLFFIILCNQMLSLLIHKALIRGTLSCYHHRCFTNLEAQSEPCQRSKMERFLEIRQWILAIDYFCKMFHLRCLAGLSIHLWIHRALSRDTLVLCLNCLASASPRRRNHFCFLFLSAPHTRLHIQHTEWCY